MFPSSPPPTAESTAAATGETSRIKSFMGRTPAIGILKSKFLTVLGNSNELLNGISSKLTLNISSSDSDYCDDDEEEVPKYDESIDYTKIDYESRRVKARRAHEEIISGRYRQPNLAPRPRLDALRSRKPDKSRSSSSSSSSSSSTSTSSRSFNNAQAQDRSHVSSTTRSDSIESRHSGGYERKRAIAGARRSELDVQRDLMRLNEMAKASNAAAVSAANVGGGGGGVGGEVALPPTAAPHIEVQPPHDRDPSKSSMANMAGTVSSHSIRVPPVRRKNSNSSTLTSLRDDLDYQVSPSGESTDWRHFIRSESQNSVPSWASSISLDCRTGEEPIKEFMKRFTDTIFTNANAIDLELKSEFGAMARLEIGRQWFVRFLLQQKNKSKRVEEPTFHSLIQHFAIVLFECGECSDFGPAMIMMNLSFLFYREIEVPGCDPYREYLCTFIREQPIWMSLKFWNAAFVECMETERNNRLKSRQKKQERRKAREKDKEKAKEEMGKLKSQNVESKENEENVMAKQQDVSESSSSHGKGNHGKKEKSAKPANDPALDFDKEMENIAFRQLATFTSNIHALGAPQELCLEFFKKQHTAVALSKEKSKLIRDNVHRIYYETELWGSKQS
ncbi:uncharacterized protein KIAA0513-like [Musca domestica]|uniref:Uncharacterized protein KIAA0513-like n=1 Tax=Musca domestica TaxID=7370 RepID=A0ABM3V0V3_MUSDO|nr:uncharacterized protein KIAA0513-like [Musca domestica]